MSEESELVRLRILDANQVDDYAVDFYRKTRPTAEEDVVHFYYIL